MPTPEIKIPDLPPPEPVLPQRRFHVMLKPAGPLCNLNCTYCFYLHKQDLLTTDQHWRMSDAVLEAHIRQYIQSQDADEVVFSWQGGEPTLLGVDYFRRVVELQQKHKKPFQRIENDLQTNGVLLDDEWCEFLARNHFLVGLSIDGPRELHDRFRVGKDGEPTFDRVLAAAKRLRKHGVTFCSLTVVNRENAKRPLDVYRFLAREVRPDRIQFIPCVEPVNFHSAAPGRRDPAVMPVPGSPEARPGNPGSIVTDWSVDPEDWGRFLSKIFDDWYQRDYGKVFVHLFETAVAQSMGLDSQVCIYHEFCGKGLALEHDGSLYPCDHYVYPDCRLGNILETPLGELAFSEKQRRFGLSKRDSLTKFCRECPYLRLCNGDCLKNRILRTAAGEPGLSYLCPGLKLFWAHIGKRMPEILTRIQRDRRGS